MKRNAIVFGLIAGLIIAVWTVCSITYCYGNNSFEGNMLLGYAAMLLTFSFVFVGVKNYRDKYNQGIISFGKAFELGLYITLIASTIYVVAWLIDYYLFIPDFMDKYSAHEIIKIQNSGTSAVQIADELSKMNSMKQMYKNPVWVILFTYAEIFPVGLLVTIITALILKRKAVATNAVAAN